MQHRLTPCSHSWSGSCSPPLHKGSADRPERFGSNCPAPGSSSATRAGYMDTSSRPSGTLTDRPLQSPIMSMQVS
ncbi:hypothetical protein DPEC_G00346640 [Dallia pectoralis]|uniref:Uncharacterized protein n=1 Tax=Dallia pectoralis TaxID=75939 RepID=A0ACC2F3T5_DALPE|nr:hypothetical protein DPEC_G00346640 [Dallia pectoralis]